jgi:hypothetical protein
MSGVSMRICKQALSILLSAFLIVEFDGCQKKEATVVQKQPSQPPPTTYAAPSADQLYQLVAPIALFPDNLLAQVLAASTFPDQVTAAYQWIQQNSSLKGQPMMQAVDQQPWDASVKGLTQFSDVLQQMATNLTWTSSLGDAYFNIPQSVMNAVQVMRQRAQQSGNLKSTPQQNVSVQNEAPGAAPAPEASSGQAQTTIVQAPPQTIVIQPSQPDVVYVPSYNPTAVYGAPVAPYPGYSTGAMVATGLLSFGVGIAVGAAMSGGCCGWGYNSWGCGWHNNTVVYNHNTYISNSNTFANRNNYYNRNNINNTNINRNNINNNNINRNNINNNNLNRNNINNTNNNRNNRANNFNNQSTPNFNQNRNQQQFRNQNQGNLGQQRAGTQPNFNQQNREGLGQNQTRPGGNQGNLGQQRGGTQPNFNQQNRAGLDNQQNRAGLNQNQPRPGGQNQRQAERGYGQQASAANGAFSNYGEGGNARTNSARGQQSLEGGGGGGGGARAAGGGGGAARGGGGGAGAGGGGGGHRGRR